MREKYIQCPFWRRTKARPFAIGCEGLVEGAKITQRFASDLDFQIQMRTFCAGRYTCCELYQAIMAAKYQED